MTGPVILPGNVARSQRWFTGQKIIPAQTKETDMPSSKPSTSPQEVLRRLLEQARAHWGEERAQEIRATLENTSEQLSEVSSNLPDKETEPGFYQ
jgi:hypothetical protein